MKTLRTENEGSQLYIQTKRKVRRGLDANSKTRSSVMVSAIKHLKKFCRMYGVKRPVVEEVTAGPTGTPDEYSAIVKTLVYTVLNKHIKCFCGERPEKPRGHKYIARLLLKVAQSYTSESQAEFEMLFSTIPDSSGPFSIRNGTEKFFWQDTQVLVPR